MLWIFAIFTILLVVILVPYLIGSAKSQLQEMDDSLAIRMKQLKRDFQFQTKELKRRLDSGDLAESEWQTLTEELKKETALSLAGTEKAAAKGSAVQTPVVFAGLMVLIVAVAFVSYEYVGFQADQINQSSVIKLIKDDAEAIDKLRNRLRENPNQTSINDLYLALRSRVDLEPEAIDAWQQLTFFNASYGREEEALKTIRVAMRKHPESLDLKVDKAQLLTSTSDTQQIIEGHKLLGEVLEKDPNHQGALLIRGDSAFRIGMYDLAIASWESLKTSMQSNPQMTKALDDRIKMATDRKAGNVTEADSQAKPTQADGANAQELAESARPGIYVRVQIDETLMDRLDGNEDIFIFARAASGPPFPIAVVRTKVGDLMGPVQLNDSQAMQEQFALSKYDEITVSARISFSGTPSATKGDIQGNSEPIKRPFPAQPVTIILDQVVE